MSQKVQSADQKGGANKAQHNRMEGSAIQFLNGIAAQLIAAVPARREQAEGARGDARHKPIRYETGGPPLRACGLS